MKSIPKIDFFVWTLAHNWILTRDNLKRKFWEGPTIYCPLYLTNEETTKHLLLSCPFAEDVWKRALLGWDGSVHLPERIHSLLINSASLCPFSTSKNALIKSCWFTFPKFIFWKLWLERNSCIFRGKSLYAEQDVTKITGLIGDCLKFLLNGSSNRPLSPSEEAWLHSLSPDLPSVVLAVRKKTVLLGIKDIRLWTW